MRPFKWKLLSSTFLWYCLLCCTRWFYGCNPKMWPFIMNSINQISITVSMQAVPNLPLTSVTACYIFLYLHFCSLLGFLSAVMASPYLWSIQSQNIKTKKKKRNLTLKIRSWLIFSIWILNSLESYFLS